MVRGAAKAQAQAKAQAKSSGQGQAKSQYGDRQKALKVNCPKCKIDVKDYNTLVIHWDSRHPKDTIPGRESFAS